MRQNYKLYLAARPRRRIFGGVSVAIIVLECIGLQGLDTRRRPLDDEVGGGQTNDGPWRFFHVAFEEPLTRNDNI